MKLTLINKKSKANRSPGMVDHLHLVAKISLHISAFSGVALVAALYFLTGDGGDDYGEVLRSLAMTRRQLVPVLLTSGMILLTLTGVITWLIALYSTFRIAGPLHHFTQTLRGQIEQGPHPMASIRPEFFLRDEHMRLAGAASRLQYHYDTVSELVDLAIVQLDLPDPDMLGGFKANIEKLQKLDRLVTL